MEVGLNTIKPIISNYQKQLQKHYEKWGVTVLPSDAFVKSAVEGLDIKKVQQKNSHFTPSNLKIVYAMQDTPFLMPKDVWSTSKIQQTVQSLKTGLEKKCSKGEFVDVTTLSVMVNKLAPDMNFKIKSKDYLEEDLEKEGYLPYQIRQLCDCSACCLNVKKQSRMYLDFEKVNSADKSEVEDFIDDFAHEIKHVLTERKTNQYVRLNNPQIKDSMGSDSLGLIAQDLGELITNKEKKEDIAPNFKKDLNQACRQNASKMPENQKNVFKYLKVHFKDEKEAYSFSDNNISIKEPEYYEEVEKLFHKEVVDMCHNRWLEGIQARKAKRLNKSEQKSGNNILQKMFDIFKIAKKKPDVASSKTKMD